MTLADFQLIIFLFNEKYVSLGLYCYSVMINNYLQRACFKMFMWLNFSLRIHLQVGRSSKKGTELASLVSDVSRCLPRRLGWFLFLPCSSLSPLASHLSSWWLTSIIIAFSLEFSTNMQGNANIQSVHHYFMNLWGISTFSICKVSHAGASYQWPY